MPNEFNIKNGFITSGNSFVYSNLTVTGILSATTISASTISSPFTTGSVIFQGSGGTLTQSNSKLFWDNTNNRLGVGTNLGAYGTTWIQSDVASTTDYTLVLNNRNTLGVGGEATGVYFANSAAGATQPYNVGHIVGSIKALATNWNNINSRGVMTFNLNNSSTVQEEVMRLVNTTKNVLIGTTTDSGYKLDVNGSGRIGDTSYYLTLTNGGSDGGIFRVGGTSYGYAQLVSYALTLNGGHSIYGTGGTNEFGLNSEVNPTASVGANKGAIVFKANNAGTGGGTWAAYTNTLAFNFLKKETTGLYTSLLALNGNTNNVGIGTITPTYKLDVFGTGTTAGISSNVGLNIQPVVAPIVTSVTYTLLTGTSLGIGTYYYRVTYYNSIGETSASNTIPITTTSGNQVVQLNNIPISTDTTVIGRKIYRDKLGDGSAYGVVVGTITNNTGTTYTDSLPDSDPVFSGSFLTRPIYAKANTTVNYISVGGVRSMIADPSLTTFGVSAGAAITVAPAVTLFGANAGQKITYGAGNTLFGYLAGFNIVGGFQNVAIGEGALAYGVVSGSYNVGLGPYVLCKEGSFNIAMGYYTGNGVTGSRNVLIGSYIGSSTSSYNDAIIIGHNATPLSGTSFQINIGNTIYGRTNTGNVMIGTTTDSGYKLDVNGSSAFRARVNIFGEAELRQDGITQTFTSSLGIFRFNAWNVSVQTAYLNGWNYEGFLNFAVNIGTPSAATASAVLEVTSTTRGFLPPRMTSAQRDAISSPATGLTVYQTTNNYLSLYNGTNWQNILSPNSAGNVLIGTTTDAGYKLDVNGTVRLSTIYFNSVATTGNISATSSSLEFNAPTSFGVFNFNCSGGGRRVSINGTASDTVGNDLLSIPFVVQNTTGVNRNFSMLNVNPTINNTSGYTGTVRGLYYNPTITSLVGTTHRAIETTAGDVLFGTSGTGLFWNNTNNRLGIGTASPNNTLDIVGGAIISSSLSISGGFTMTEASNVHTFTAPATNRTIRFITNSQSYSLFPTGNFAIGTTTDAGVKLDVNGTARVSGNLTAGLTTAGSDNLFSFLGSDNGFFRVRTLSGAVFIGLGDTTNATSGNFFGITRTYLNEYGNINAFMSTDNRDFGFRFGPYGSSVEALRITTTKIILSPNTGNNVLIGKTTDSGQKLQVSGDTLIQGGLTVNGNLSTTGTTTLGNGTFTKAGFATGDVLLDNNSTDTPGVLFYYGNNSNYGIDSWNGSFDVLSGQLLRFTNKLNETGGAVKMAIDTSGNLAVGGFVKVNAWQAGQIVQMKLFNASDLSFNSNYTNNTNTYTSVVSGTYTPLSSSSYIFFEVYAMYDVGGAAADSFFSQITWNGAEVGVQRQVWANGSGGGTRSGTLFPLAGRVTNSSLTGYGWSVNVRRDSSDDGITVYNNSGFYVKITEIAR